MTKPQIRVLLVDDHSVVRGGLRFFLAGADDIAVVGEGASGAEALELVARLAPDLVIMDVMMPGMDGIATTRELRRRFPEVRVLALTSFGEGELVQRALQAGAIGYLLKDTQGSELVGAVRTAVAGAPVLSPDVTRALVSALNTPPAPGVDLSERELEVLRLMVAGLSNEQIAERLYISRNTVRHHVHNILGKLGAANRTEAVGLAVQHNLVG
ncbi:MAG TPA: response regulator transcription factor [Chloroflexaceae bacterium]|nr:response regulator transcription factor [Chloroflexaceae bacterium]